MRGAFWSAATWRRFLNWKTFLSHNFKYFSYIVLAYSKNRKTVPGHRTPKRFALFLNISNQHILLIIGESSKWPLSITIAQTAEATFCRRQHRPPGRIIAPSKKGREMFDLLPEQRGKIPFFFAPLRLAFVVLCL